MRSANRVAPDAGPAGAEILFVIGSLEVGGTERHLATLAPALVKLGWSVSVYNLAGSGALQGEIQAAGVRVIVPPFKTSTVRSSVIGRMAQSVRIGAHLFRVMRQRRPAIVHFFLPAAYLVGAPAAISAGVPVRIMSRRSLNVYQRSYPLVSDLERRLHRRMTAILGNSRSVVRELSEMEGVPVRRLGLIYNGIDVARFTDAGSPAATRAALSLGPQTLTLVIVGNLIPYKGHGDLLAALGQAAPHLPPDWRLLIVGRDQGIASSLQAQAAQLCIGGQGVIPRHPQRRPGNPERLRHRGALLAPGGIFQRRARRHGFRPADDRDGCRWKCRSRARRRKWHRGAAARSHAPCRGDCAPSERSVVAGQARTCRTLPLG